MATFYGQVEGMAQTIASRRGSNASDIKAIVQSYDGSIITRMYYGKDDVLCIAVYHDSGSSFYGNLVFDGTVEQFLEKMKEDTEGKEI